MIAWLRLSVQIREVMCDFLPWRLSKHRLEKLRADFAGEGEGVKGYPYTFWAFSRQMLTQSFSKIPEVEEQIALQVAQLILTYAGLGQSGTTNIKIKKKNARKSTCSKLKFKKVLFFRWYDSSSRRWAHQPSANHNGTLHEKRQSSKWTLSSTD